MTREERRKQDILQGNPPEAMRAAVEITRALDVYRVEYDTAATAAGRAAADNRLLNKLRPLLQDRREARE